MRWPVAAAASVVVGGALAAAAVAQQEGIDPRAPVPNFAPQEEAAPAQLKIDLPQFPRPENLLPFDTPRVGQFQFFIDSQSLAVEADGLIRYTVVAKSATATNVSVELMSCRGKRRLTYAYGRPDGTWYVSKKDSAAWADIGSEASGGYRFVLYQNYFCPAGNGIKSAAEGLYALKRAGHPSTLDTGYGTY